MTSNKRNSIFERRYLRLAAAGFAIKEACFPKQLARRLMVASWLDFEVSFSQDTPSICLLDATVQRAFNLCPDGLRHRFQLEVRSDATWVLAMAVLYAGEGAFIDLATSMSRGGSR